MVTLEIEGRLPSRFPRDLAERLVSSAYRIGGGRGSAHVSVSLVDDGTMRRLNKAHRGNDKTTDVLSFPYVGDGFPVPKGEVPLLGEIIVSLPQVRRQAAGIGRTVREEFALMLVHGTLHLLGYDHEEEDEETEMFGLQHEILCKEGIF